MPSAVYILSEGKVMTKHIQNDKIMNDKNEQKEA